MRRDRLLGPVSVASGGSPRGLNGDPHVLVTAAFTPPYLAASRLQPEKSRLQAGCPHADGPHANDPQAPGQEPTDPEADQANRDGSRDRQGHDKLVKEPD